MENPQELLDGLVQRYHLQPDDAGLQFLGIHRGVGLSVRARDGMIGILFFAPGADVGCEILEHFKGFTHCAAGGLPIEWLEGRVEDDHSCLLELDKRRIAAIGLEASLAVPDLVAQDFVNHGAPEPMPCVECRNAAVRVVNRGGLMCLCQTCEGDNLPVAKPPPAAQRLPQPVLWKKVCLRLLISFVLAGSAWSAAQVYEARMEAPLGILLYVVPLIYGFGIPIWIAGTGTGVSRALALVVAGVVIAATLIGNVAGLWATLDKKFPGFSWFDAGEIYFTIQLRHNLSSEIPYLIGGIIGTVGGFLYLRKEGTPAA